MPRTIITIGIGRAGTRVASKFLHSLLADLGGAHPERDTPFFDRTSSGSIVPRAVFVDTDPRDGSSLQDSLANSSVLSVHSSSVFTGEESAARCFARAYKGAIDTQVAQVLDRVRVLADGTNVGGFVLVHALGGGTGSGLAAKIAEQLHANYPKKAKVCAALFPARKRGGSPLDVMNAALALHKLAPKVDTILMADNDALSGKAGTFAPHILNARLARTLTNFALCVQKGHLNMGEITTHLKAVTTAPFVIASSTNGKQRKDAAEQIEQLMAGVGARATFSTGSWSRPPLSSLLVWRGAYTGREKKRGSNALVSASAMGVGATKSVHIARAERTPTRSLHAFTAHAAVGQMLDARILRPYARLLDAGAFVEQVTGDGVSMSTLTAARSSLEAWVQHYASLQAAG